MHVEVQFGVVIQCITTRYLECISVGVDNHVQWLLMECGFTHTWILKPGSVV